MNFCNFQSLLYKNISNFWSRAEEKAKAEAAARAAEEKAKAEAAARAAEEKRAARREAKARARKEAIARLATDKGISEEEAERILKERARARKAAAQKAATDATATDNSEEQKYGNIPAEEIRDKREKAVRKGYEDMLATDPDSKAAKKKKKEEAETAKAKEDVKSRKCMGEHISFCMCAYFEKIYWQIRVWESFYYIWYRWSEDIN